MILYIHGFGSCGHSKKTCMLKGYFCQDFMISPDIPVEPDVAVAYLEEMVAKHRPHLLIGSSLGAYYATYLAERHGLDAILLNPSIRPFETLAESVGTNTYWCSEQPFEWKAEYLEQLKAYRTTPEKCAYLVLLQSGDEVLDYREALAFYDGQEIIVEEGGNHRFENLEEYLPLIDAVYRRK